MENYVRIKKKISLSDDNYNNVESENILHILVHESPYVTLKIGFHGLLYHHHHRRRRRHHLAKTELDHLMTLSGLTHRELPSVVSPGTICCLVCNFYYPRYTVKGHSVNMSFPVSFVILYFFLNCGYI